MPTKSATALFLGIELATDQLRATLIDDTLDLVAVECVDFDQELPEYGTHGGIFTTPGEAYTTPVDMWIKALDVLLERLGANHDLSRVKALSGSGQPAVVHLATPTLPPLHHSQSLHAQLTPVLWALPNVATPQSPAAHAHALYLADALGGADACAARTGGPANGGMAAAQLVWARAEAAEAWDRTRRVVTCSTLLASIFLGGPSERENGKAGANPWAPLTEAEAALSGMWDRERGQWDESVLEIVAGTREDARRVKGWLGDVAGGGRSCGRLGGWARERFGFSDECLVLPFSIPVLSTYLSLLPQTGDAVLSFGPSDHLLTAAAAPVPSRLAAIIPHPAESALHRALALVPPSGSAQDTRDPQGASASGGRQGRRYVAMTSSRNADVPRALVRDMYTKSWSAFDRLVQVVPPGGSIGLDDKLFGFFLLQPDLAPFAHIQGIFRFETGVKVQEFRDLRANPRTLLESQILAFRVRWARLLTTGALGPKRGSPTSPNPTTTSFGKHIPGSPQRDEPEKTPAQQAVALAQKRALGLSFDPYDRAPLPTRVLAVGGAINFPALASLVADIFAAPLFVPATQLDSASHRNAPAAGVPSRATLGSAYLSRWVWGRERGGGGRLSGFEDECRRLLGKRWVASGGVPLRTNVNAPASAPSRLAASISRPDSGAGVTPYANRSGLGATVFVEEDEEGAEDSASTSAGENGLYAGVPGFGDVDLGPTARARTVTATSMETSMSTASTTTAGATSTAFTSPDPGAASRTPSVDSPAGLGGPAPLAPVCALPTADAEAQIGLAKVADPDYDTFAAYASVVPEYCRLEGVLVRSLG